MNSPISHEFIDTVENRLKNCPWCSQVPTFVTDDKGTCVMCLNVLCKVKPISENFHDKNTALESWNNPIRITERKFTESDLKDIFIDLMVDRDIWNYFWPNKELYEK